MADNPIINFSLLKIKTEQFAIFDENFNKSEVINLPESDFQFE
jgi:hypothetical protein